MPFAYFLKNLFSEKTPEFQEIPDFEPESQQNSVVEHSQKRMIEELIGSDEEFPNWLSNEDALRDEGVIFGLSDTLAEEKLKIIEAIFSKKAAGLNQKRDELSEKIGELNLFIEKKHEDLEDLKSKSAVALEKETIDENVLRVSIGLLLSIGMCVGNYFLIDEGLKNAYPSSHQWISWGVFLTGMFSLFNPTAVLHNDTKLDWKRLLEEFGMPFAASFFVFVQIWDTLPFYKSLAFLLFTFFAFLISGKILLSSVAKLKYEIKALKHNLKLKSDKKKVDSVWLDDKEGLDASIENLRIQKWKILPELNEVEAQIQKIKAEKENIENVFLSEYNLAKNYRQKLSNNQIKNIIR
ncbi:hypothetical protein EGI22_12275 [Lacihabitans sp. LS3-19]|uniref:hypothetical protein n=1 Tax=Lacihabitans sp. LS3-19 TaxID=2487335 RepID=UPI0020CEDD37|nr:hypothetical protein [Lacihabitans sp. LS3-19]MCP9768694.1 hypothetical protein [Lacihabitans sp. LS3-19]